MTSCSPGAAGYTMGRTSDNPLCGGLIGSRDLPLGPQSYCRAAPVRPPAAWCATVGFKCPERNRHHRKLRTNLAPRLPLPTTAPSPTIADLWSPERPQTRNGARDIETRNGRCDARGHLIHPRLSGATGVTGNEATCKGATRANPLLSTRPCSLAPARSPHQPLGMPNRPPGSVPEQRCGAFAKPGLGSYGFPAQSTPDSEPFVSAEQPS